MRATSMHHAPAWRVPTCLGLYDDDTNAGAIQTYIHMQMVPLPLDRGGKSVPKVSVAKS